MAHDFDPLTSWCRRCGAAEAEVRDGLRLDCKPVLDGDGSVVPVRTFGRPGGKTIARLLWKSAEGHS